MAKVHVHRFRDGAGVAILESDGTVYLAADDAEAIGRQLIAIAESIRNESFSASPPLTLAVPARPHGFAKGETH